MRAMHIRCSYGWCNYPYRCAPRAGTAHALKYQHEVRRVAWHAKMRDPKTRWQPLGTASRVALATGARRNVA